MSRFTPLQWVLIIIFIIYWFIFFPIIWFAVRPAIIVGDIVQALLFAVFLLLIYCILYLLVLCCFDRCTKSVSLTPVDKQKEEPLTRGLPPAPPVRHPPPLNAVYYMKPPYPETNPNDDTITDPQLRFISSYQLFYDGSKFREDIVV